MKKVFVTLFIIAIVLAGVYFYFFHLAPIKKNNPINAVPENAALIVQFEDPFEQWNKLTSNEIWNYLKTNSYLSEIGYSIDSINTEIKKNASLWEVVAARPLVISAHEIRKNEYDYLYVVDLQKATQLNFIQHYIDQLTDDNTKVLTRSYHNEQIVEITFTDSPTRYYMNIDGNLLSVSTTHTLIEQSIDQKDEPVIARNLNFVDISRHMDSDKITLYLQHDLFINLLNQWLATGESTTLDFLKSIIFTGINFDMNDDHFSTHGHSNVIDSVPNLLNTLYKSREGEIGLSKIAPDNTSFFLSLGFDNASDFYKNLEESLLASEDGKDYQQNKEKLEKFLDISIEEHFLSWIDDEIGVIQLHSNTSNTAAEFALAIKHKGIDDAKENLDFIKNQIRKKTPVKFRGIDYKGYEINFLSVKGFFKIILGKAFSKLEKPYYTIMDDYVVFSNTPKTLGKLINNSHERTTLSNNSTFNDYMGRFDDESMLFVYVNPEQLITDSKKFLDRESWQTVSSHRSYIESFPMIGVQLKPDGKLLTHDIIFEYMNKEQIQDWNSLFTHDMPSSDILVEEEDAEESIAVEDILPDDLNDKMMEDHYPNGQLKYEVSLKNGMKHGRYFEYDSAGNVIIKGRYKNDNKSGTWKYYDEAGDVVRKERY